MLLSRVQHTTIAANKNIKWLLNIHSRIGSHSQTYKQCMQIQHKQWTDNPIDKKDRQIDRYIDEYIYTNKQVRLEYSKPEQMTVTGILSWLQVCSNDINTQKILYYV